MLVLSHEDVLAALEPEACADAMAEVLVAHARGEAYFPLRSVVAPPNANGFIGLMPAWRGGHRATFALKALCVMPGNPARGLDSHQGVVILSDPDTGIPTAILDASAVTAIRTAAVSAIATRTLARADAKVLTILGSGVQGRAHQRALGADFDEVRMYSPKTGGSAEETVRGADVVVTATNSREPVLEREWLAPGTHINAVGASMPTARELDTRTVLDAALFCDSRESLRNEAGEFIEAIAQGAIDGEDHVRGELGEVLADKVDGRRDDHELTIFRSLGLAIEDLAAGQLAVAVARAKGIGTDVEL